MLGSGYFLLCRRGGTTEPAVKVPRSSRCVRGTAGPRLGDTFPKRCELSATAFRKRSPHIRGCACWRRHPPADRGPEKLRPFHERTGANQRHRDPDRRGILARYRNEIATLFRFAASLARGGTSGFSGDLPLRAQTILPRDQLVISFRSRATLPHARWR